MPAEAVAAIHRATAGSHQKGASFVFVQDATGFAGGQVTDGIELETGCRLQFLIQGQDLAQQGIIRVAVAHTGHEGPGHAQGKTGIVGRQTVGQMGQTHLGQEFAGAGDDVPVLTTPIRRLRRVGACRYHVRLVRFCANTQQSLIVAAQAAGKRSRPMASLGMNDVKNGLKIIVEGQPCVIVDTDFIKPGKGQAFTRVRYRNLKTGRVVELTMKSTDSVETADVVDTEMQYLYSDGEFWHFMQQESFEQYSADAAVMSDVSQWLKGEEICNVTLWNGSPIAVQPPNFVELQIVETDPGLRGDTSGGGGKPAKLETGAVVRVPLFVNQDEIIKVDTRSGEYVSRVK